MSYIIKGVRHVMGTFVTIAVAHPAVDEAREVVRAAFDEIYRINNLMSVHRGNSEVSILNRDGFYRGVSADMEHVIHRSKYFAELSGGVFDIAVLPFLKLWQEKARCGAVPDGAEIDRTLGLVDYKDILIEDGSVRFGKAGMGITLAGAAKGYAVDRAIEVLRRGSIRHAMVNAGGDIRVIGGKTGTVPWRIALRDPVNRRRLRTTFELYDRAIATSGIYQRFGNDMIDPKAGKPAQGVLSSTVIAGTAIDADILATCLYILGAQRGAGLLKKLSGVEALVVNSDGSTLRLSGKTRSGVSAENS